MNHKYHNATVYTNNSIIICDSDRIFLASHFFEIKAIMQEFYGILIIGMYL